MLERFLRHFAGYVDKPHGSSTPVQGSFDVNLIEREPYGVVGVIAPWNGHLPSPARAWRRRWPRATVVFKPSELAPLAALRFGELCLAAGLPQAWSTSYLRAPRGRRPGASPRHPQDPLHRRRRDRAQVITAATTNLTPVVAELGGKSANIVFGDADLQTAAALSAHQPLMQSGQSCACASRILAHDSVYDEFVDIFLARIAAAKIGDPLDPAVPSDP